MTEDIRKSFHHQLEEIQTDIVRMAAMVTEKVPRATDVLLDTDLPGAQALVEGDAVVNALAWDVQERCYQLLALQQPMAGDLRAIVAAIHMVSEIERSGDLVVNVTKAARRLYGTDFSPRLRWMLRQMSEEATKLFRLAVDAYVDQDASKAAALDDLDDRLDTLRNAYIEEIFEAHGKGDLAIRSGVQLALIGRYYERIGDHAVNMGERVRYMVTGWLPEHDDAEHVAAGVAAGELTLDEISGGSALTAVDGVDRADGSADEPTET
jgi:phosphate transport system protein